MRLIVEVLDENGARVTDGPLVNVRSATVTRRLDGAGSVSISVPGNDGRTLDVLRPESRVRILLEQDGAGLREMGYGIIRDVSRGESASGSVINASGPDILEELKHRVVGIDRRYDDAAIDEIVADLVTLVSGWTSATTGANAAAQISVRLDTMSVLKALQEIIGFKGQHLRLGTGKQVEVGDFGDLIDLVLLNPERISDDMLSNNNIAFIETLQEIDNSDALINRLYVLGAGANVDSALTLEASTRTTPFEIKSVSMNGRDLYYIEDEDSINEYGVLEKFGQFKQIAPLSTSATDLERGANALYDIAAAWLPRYSAPQQTYAVSVVKCRQTIKPGDRVRLNYTGPVVRADDIVETRQLDGEFFVMSVSEAVSSGGVIVNVEISTLDRYRETTAKTLIGALDKIRLEGTVIQPTLSHYATGPEQIQIDNTTNGQVDLIIQNYTYSIERVLMRVRTRRFVSNAKGAAATTSAGGGDHFHDLGLVGSALEPAPTRWHRTFLYDNVGSIVNVVFGGLGGSLAITSNKVLRTQTSSGDHTHTIPELTLVYGMFRDTLRPAGMTITVNGVSVLSGAGSTGADYDNTIDITEEVRNKAGGFQAAHPIVVSCSSGRGEVLISFDVVEQLLPFRYQP